jgi:hypothetical protein
MLESLGSNERWNTLCGKDGKNTKENHSQTGRVYAGGKRTVISRTSKRYARDFEKS